MTTETQATEFNPFDPTFRSDPYPAYARLREHAPVRATTNPAGVYTVACYDDVTHVLKSTAVFSSAAMGGGATLMGTPVRSIISSDPPQHTQMRNLVNRAFTPRMVADMEPRIREIARSLLDAVEARGDGEIDVVRDLAVPLPVTVIAEILGVDPERRDDFKRWSNAVITNISVDGDQQQTSRDREEFQQYFAQMTDERRSSPAGDLISALVAAEEGDLRLSPDEVVSFAMLLLIAGNETTTNLIGNAMLALLDHPDQLAMVQADASRIPNMVEEALRWDSPVQFLFRRTTQDTEVHGVPIPKDAGVVPMYASANRDSTRFPDGERFDITRNTQGHVAFGLGPHFCLGAPLARLEARVAFEELFARMPSFERTSTDVDRLDSMFLRGLRSLPLRVT